MKLNDKLVSLHDTPNSDELLQTHLTILLPCLVCWAGSGQKEIAECMQSEPTHGFIWHRILLIDSLMVSECDDFQLIKISCMNYTMTKYHQFGQERVANTGCVTAKLRRLSFSCS